MGTGYTRLYILTVDESKADSRVSDKTLLMYAENIVQIGLGVLNV